jgi:hypothetical protein
MHWIYTAFFLFSIRPDTGFDFPDIRPHTILKLRLNFFKLMNAITARFKVTSSLYTWAVYRHSLHMETSTGKILHLTLAS